MSSRSSLAASQNSMVSPSGGGRSKRTVVMELFPGSCPGARDPGRAHRVPAPGIDPRRRHRPCCNEPHTGVNFRHPTRPTGGPTAMLMDEHLGRMAEQFGDETAFAVVDVGSLTFAEWDGAANAMARRLLEEGLEPGGRVGIHLRPELALHWLISYSAAHRAGGVAVPMNPRLAPAEVAHMLEHSGATIVVADGDLLQSDGEAGTGRLLALVDAGAEAGTPPPDIPLLSWGEVTAGDRTPLQVPRQSEDLADILYTSGTTGRPKGDGRRGAARQPALHLRRHRAGVHADEAGPAGDLPAALRRRALAARGR